MSSSHNLNFEFFYCFHIWLIDTGLFSVFKAQEYRLLSLILIRQMMTNDVVTTTIGELSQTLSTGNRVVYRALDSLVKRGLLLYQKQRAQATILTISINLDLPNRKSWPELSGYELNRLMESAYEHLHELGKSDSSDKEFRPFTDGCYVLGQTADKHRP